MNNSEIENIHIKDLVNHVRKGECILFLGAGVHAPPPKNSKYKYPADQRPLMGSELVEKLARECNFESQVPRESPCDIQRVSLCFELTRGRKQLVDYLYNQLRKNKKPSPALKMLAKMPFKIIMTTNYDNLLESAMHKIEKHPREPVIFIYNPNPKSDERTPDMTEDPTVERPLIFKMHGDLDQRDCIVITDEDYITFVQRMSDKDPLHPVPQTVRFRMQKWPTLFVGYSLRDYNLRLLFRTLRWRLDPANIPSSYSVDKHPDPLILKVWQHERNFITFVTQDLWTFVPWLYNQISQKECQNE